MPKKKKNDQARGEAVEADRSSKTRRIPKADKTKRQEKPKKEPKPKPEKTVKAPKEEKPKKKHPRKKYEGGISGDLIYITLMIVAVSAAVWFAVSAFFTVSDIDVVGAQRTNAAQIRASSGITVGDRLLFINRFTVKDKIFAENPFVKEVSVKKYPPDRIVLEVTERQPVAAVASGSVYYLVDEDCKLLEYFPITGPCEYPTITGLTVKAMDLGKDIVLEDDLRFISLQAVTAALSVDKEITEKMGEINMDKLYDVYFTYDGRLRVNLGEAVDLPKKLKLLGEVLKKLESTDKGTISLKHTDNVTFLPD